MSNLDEKDVCNMSNFLESIQLAFWKTLLSNNRKMNIYLIFSSYLRKGNFALVIAISDFLQFHKTGISMKKGDWPS